MSGDKRTVSTDALETLGTIINESAGRDAIHLAVEPVIAAMTLRPGEDVGLGPDGSAAVASLCPQPLGIVDPFLKAPVKKGERFWLVVYPRQITSLRHVWTHPAFEQESIAVPSDRKARSEEWLRNYLQTADAPSYETIIAVAIKGADGEGYYRSYMDGEYFHVGGHDASGNIPPEFWDHVENIIGKKVSGRPSYFSCSC
jgi:hypothetical protein